MENADGLHNWYRQQVDAEIERQEVLRRRWFERVDAQVQAEFDRRHAPPIDPAFEAEKAAILAAQQHGRVIHRPRPLSKVRLLWLAAMFAAIGILGIRYLVQALER